MSIDLTYGNLCLYTNRMIIRIEKEILIERSYEYFPPQQYGDLR